MKEIEDPDVAEMPDPRVGYSSRRGHKERLADAAHVIRAILNAGEWFASALEINVYESPYDGDELKEMAIAVLAALEDE
jgi:hypothetical protein